MIRTFQPCLLPGLLQTPAYVRALIAAGPVRSKQQTDALVEFRMSRQRILDRDDPPSYVAVVSEGAFINEVGGPTTMRAQLDRLAKVVQHDQVELYVLPTSASANLWLAGPFDLFRLRPPGRLTVTVSEQFSRSLFIENDDEVAEQEAIFEHLRNASLGRHESRALIERLVSDS